MIQQNKIVIGIVGLGYTGLPLALQFGKFFKTIGYDINQKKVNELNSAVDITNEASSRDIKYFLKKNKITNNEKELAKVNVFIVAVPTPVSKKKNPRFNIT